MRKTSLKWSRSLVQTTDSRSSSKDNIASFFGFGIFWPLIFFFFFGLPHLYGALNFKKENVTVKLPRRSYCSLDRKTSGLVTEYTARFVQFDESRRIHCPCKRRIFPSISFSTVLLILTKAFFGCSLSLLLPQCSIPVRTLLGNRELQKKDIASVTLVFGVFALPLH